MSERSKEHASKACEGETLREFESRLIRSTPWVPPAGFLVIKPKTAWFQRFRGVSPHQAGLRRVAYRYMLRRILGDTLGAWWARAATPVRMIGNNFGPHMPWRDVWETGTLFRSACASCIPRHAKLNNIVVKAAAPGCALRSARSRTYATRHIAHGLGMASPVCHAAYAGAYVNRHYGSWAGLKAFRPTWTRFSRTRESGATVQSERSADMRISISCVFVWNSKDIEKKV